GGSGRGAAPRPPRRQAAGGVRAPARRENDEDDAGGERSDEDQRLTDAFRALGEEAPGGPERSRRPGLGGEHPAGAQGQGPGAAAPLGLLAVDGALQLGLVHRRPALDPEVLGLGVELLARAALRTAGAR